MALRTRAEHFQAGTRITTEQIYRTSSLVTTLTGRPVQHNKAIVGSNAFAHEAGIHQDGMLKNRMTYEIMTPQSIGIPDQQVGPGQALGTPCLPRAVEELGYTLAEDDLQKAYEHFIEVADKKKEVIRPGSRRRSSAGRWPPSRTSSSWIISMSAAA